MDTTCEAQGNVYDQQCPCRSILDRIADKWTALIIGKLADQPTRFNQLKRDIPGISPKSLTQTLRALERDGIVTRTIYPTVPVSVEYALTPLGQSLIAPLAAVRQWAQDHKTDVLNARHRYDTQQPPPSPATLNAA